MARFLKLNLRSEIVVDREVQIRRKEYKGGESGSRTDIGIHALDAEKGRTVTLWIEVKCNWNPSAKTALKEQLIKKYMSGGTAEAGILLLGWFYCKDWNAADDRKSKTNKTWADQEAARADLSAQAERVRQDAGLIVESVVIDCTLE